MNTFPKLQVLQEHMPKALLQPMTVEATNAVSSSMLWQGLVLIHHFPFRVGLESRVIRRGNRVERIERTKQDESEPNNNLYLIDFGESPCISREHFQIESGSEGFLLVDRGSACGTWVESNRIEGGDAGGTLPLLDGQLIFVGAKSSPYVYRFVSFADCEVVCSGGVDKR